MRSFDRFSDTEMLARIMDAEAGQEGPLGKLAVGAVIQNRARVGGYGDGIRGVITKPGQFSAINDVTGYAGGKGANRQFWRKPSDESVRIAEAVIAGNYQDPTDGATHYYNPAAANPKWARGKQFRPIGNHVFGNADAGRVAGGGGSDTLAGGGQSDYFRQRFEREQGGQNARQATQSQQTGGGQDSYFRQRFEAAQAKRAGPNVNTKAPTAPKGMDAPAEPGFFRRNVDALVNAVVGDAQYDVPEIESDLGAMTAASGGDPASLARVLFLADGEEAMANIIQKHAPGTPIEADDNGNLYAIVNGERYALDKSGLSGRDATELVKGLVGALITVTGAKAGGFLAGGFGRVGGAGAGAAGEQAGEQIASEAVGGGQGFDMGRVVLAGLFGFGGEGLTKIVELVGPRMVEAIGFARAGAGSRQEFEAALTAQGFSPQEVIDTLNSALRQTEHAELGPDALARIADAQLLDVPIDLTTGQATRSPMLWREEHSAGTFGERVGREAERTRNAQQAGLAENADTIMDQFQAGAERSERGEAVQSGLRARRDAAWNRVNVAYERARNAPNQPVVSEGPLVTFISETQRRIRGQYTPGPDDMTQRLIQDFRETVAEDGTSLVDLERWRSRATNARQNARGTDRAALNELIRSYDEAITGRLMEGATGDRGTVALWRRAVASRREFGRTYENDSIVDRLSRNSSRRGGELDISAEDVMGELLGQAGFGGKKGAAREAMRLREFLGADSSEWRQIQAEGLVRLLGFEPSQFAGGNIPTKIVNNLRKALREKPRLFNALFTDSQRDQIRRFARVVETTSISPKDAGTPNPSGSGLMSIEDAGRRFERIQRAAEALGRSFGTAGSVIANVVLKSVTGAGDAAQAAAARRSLQGLPPVRTPAPAAPGVGGAVGAGVGMPLFGQ